MILRSMTAIAITGLLFVQPAAAQERGIYVGGSYGGTDYGQTPANFDDPSGAFGPGSLVSGTVDNTDDGWSLVVGYRLGRYFNLEGGWTDLGEVNFKGQTNGLGGLYECPTGPTEPCDVSVSSATDGLFIVGVGVLPLGRFGILGRVGLYDRKSDFQVMDARSEPYEGSSDSTETVYGLGVEYRFDGGPTVRIEWTTYTDILTIFNDADVEYYSAGLVYQITKK